VPASAYLNVRYRGMHARNAWRCGAVRCGAVRCDAVPSRKERQGGGAKRRKTEGINERTGLPERGTTAVSVRAIGNVVLVLAILVVGLGHRPRSARLATGFHSYYGVSTSGPCRMCMR
jgi:hypothetical protein